MRLMVTGKQWKVMMAVPAFFTMAAFGVKASEAPEPARRQPASQPSQTRRISRQFDGLQ